MTTTEQLSAEAVSKYRRFRDLSSGKIKVPPGDWSQANDDMIMRLEVAGVFGEGFSFNKKGSKNLAFVLKEMTARLDTSAALLQAASDALTASADLIVVQDKKLSRYRRWGRAASELKEILWLIINPWALPR